MDVCIRSDCSCPIPRYLLFVLNVFRLFRQPGLVGRDVCLPFLWAVKTKTRLYHSMSGDSEVGSLFSSCRAVLRCSSQA